MSQTFICAKICSKTLFRNEKSTENNIIALRYFCSLIEILSNGSGGRLALGSTVLLYLIVYNEASAPSVVFATLLATLFAVLAGKTSIEIKNKTILVHSST